MIAESILCASLTAVKCDGQNMRLLGRVFR